MSDIEKKDQDQDQDKFSVLSERIESLEDRLTKLESALRIEWVDEKEESSSVRTAEKSEKIESAESRIVEYGLGWLGSIVFLLGIVFLMSYIENNGYPFLSRVIAYFLTAMILSFSYYLRGSFPVLVQVLNICSWLLLYYITLTLHYISEQPLVNQEWIILVAVFVIIGSQFYNAIQKNSQMLGILGILLAVITALISDSTYIIFSILTFVAIVSHTIFYFKIWWRVHIFSLFAVYLTHFIWLFGNFPMGHSFRLVDSSYNNLWFLLGYAVIFSLSIFLPKEKQESNEGLISISIWNALFLSLLLLLIIPTFYLETYSSVFVGLAIYFINFGILLKFRTNRDFGLPVYTSFGFMALSVAIYGYLGFPDAYVPLFLQSILVVSVALWCKSKLLVIANLFLFITILMIYMMTSESINSVNFTIVATAFGTARILGWQKERLALKTEGFRNLYLLIGFVMILFTLNKVLPDQYVTLGWIATAIVFLVLSLVLSNIKYRYLSIATILVSGAHLFFVDLGQMELFFRIIAFLVFAVISIGVSLYYTKRIRNK